MGKSYEKKREEALKFTANDKALATTILDRDRCSLCPRPYHAWAHIQWDKAREIGDYEMERFFSVLMAEIVIDEIDVLDEWGEIRISLFKLKAALGSVLTKPRTKQSAKKKTILP